ncbi:hypothetical protein sscle_15g102900 [Sclerotinia sclerotiorum 1980 UF-70]|uniref:Cytochrome P450 alkane hydroxylase n=1 Tax=Sclerotinia sclerotiorum (strain ATCC 18683 / 1980 / Ss-1) TaxID=665079 RepID=A0A1D9QKQ5_SCLS1|nr:hypothetical protein sscle_15g102900 [Sclerotinia sclerotiorum 1980 UF-70]
MAYYGLSFILIVAAFLVHKITNHVSARRFQKAHCCKPVHKLPQRERIIGWDMYKFQVKSAKEKRRLKAGYDRYKENGNTYVLSMMGFDFFNTIEPENLKTLLAVNFKDYDLGARRGAFSPLLGDGIFTTDGAQWEHSRALVRPNFNKSQVADLNIFEKHIQVLLSQIPRDGSTFDLQSLFFKLTLDTATEFLFGKSVHSLTSIEGSEQQKFGAAFDLGQIKLEVRFTMGKLSNWMCDSEFDEACKTVHSFVDKIVYEALSKIDAKEEKAVEGHGPGRYVFLTEMVKASRDPKQLRDELLNILLAGRDTTASLLSNTFHILARRPDIWEKLKAEVDELHGERPDYETMKGMKYIKYVLNESLRLYPVVPSNARFSRRDTVLPVGGGPDRTSPIFIPKGSAVAWSTYSMHRRTDIFGPDAEEFRPERWAPEEGLRPGWGYLPFNGGPRICVGQQFALAEASYTIIRLLQEFDRILDRDGTEWKEQFALTACSAKGVQVGMIPRRM